MFRAAPFVAWALATAQAQFQPFQNPPWPPSWAMADSTLAMQANVSGWFDPNAAARFSIVSFDWSSGKDLWVNQQPMAADLMAIRQAKLVMQTNPGHRVFVYKNLVKALPWFSAVREKLDDPQYSGWFLPFKPGGSLPNGSYHVPPCTGSKCSNLYHDQEQTPGYPHGDGSCAEPCDCGKSPCGEYLWDHRNASLREWLVIEYMLGATGLGSGVVQGFFVDDYWSGPQGSNNSLPGTAPGPSEIDSHCLEDMGLSDSDVEDITQGWIETMSAMQLALVEAGAYTWSLIPGEAYANAMPVTIDQATCAATVENGCSGQYDSAPLLFGLTPARSNDWFPSSSQEVAAFLLMRGPYAWAGWGEWGMVWPSGSDWNDPHSEVIPFPAEMLQEYGTAVGKCVQTKPGVFSRQYENLTITLDCNTWNATYSWRSP
jgi:hypothetical protein